MKAEKNDTGSFESKLAIYLFIVVLLMLLLVEDRSSDSKWIRHMILSTLGSMDYEVLVTIRYLYDVLIKY